MLVLQNLLFESLFIRIYVNTKFIDSFPSAFEGNESMLIAKKAAMNDKGS